MKGSDQALVGLLGLGMRAGQVVSGEGACVTAIRSGKAALVLLDAASSQNARKRFTDACTHHDVPLYILPEDVVGNAIGKPGRMALVLAPGGLAEKARAALDGAGRKPEIDTLRE